MSRKTFSDAEINEAFRDMYQVFLQHVSARCREAVTMVVEEGSSYRAVAEVQGGSVESVRTHLKRFIAFFVGTMDHATAPDADVGDGMDDRDLGLIIDYLANELSPHYMAHIERRLMEDDAFRQFAMPIAILWTVNGKRREKPREQIKQAREELDLIAGITRRLN